MSAPQVSGVAALVMAAHPELQEHPDGVLRLLRATARTDLVNHTGKSSASTGAAWDGTPCATGYCHVTFTESADGPERDPLRLGVWGGHGQRRGGDLALARSAARRHSRTQSPPW